MSKFEVEACNGRSHFSSFLCRIVNLKEVMMQLTTMTMQSCLLKISRLAMSRTCYACNKK